MILCGIVRACTDMSPPLPQQFVSVYIWGLALLTFGPWRPMKMLCHSVLQRFGEPNDKPHAFL
jgi:hypothetical protein